MNPTDILILMSLAMLFIEVCLTIWLGRYVAGMNKQIADINERTVGICSATFLQGRKMQDVITEMHALLKAHEA
jgi:hypothetical protein